MNLIELHGLTDRSQWGSGPWDSEPDRVLWRDEDTGLLCLIERQAGLGHLCGYVAVGPGHALYGKRRHEVQLRVHGAVTFAGALSLAGIEDDLWWFGFDCAHAYDFVPFMTKALRKTMLGMMRPRAYRDIAYVRREVQKLAAQLVREGGEHPLHSDEAFQRAIMNGSAE